MVDLALRNAKETRAVAPDIGCGGKRETSKIGQRIEPRFDETLQQFAIKGASCIDKADRRPQSGELVAFEPLPGQTGRASAYLLRRPGVERRPGNPVHFVAPAGR